MAINIEGGAFIYPYETKSHYSYTLYQQISMACSIYSLPDQILHPTALIRKKMFYTHFFYRKKNQNKIYNHI